MLVSAAIALGLPRARLAAEGTVRGTVWSRKKALLIISDDWGMCAWCPTAQAYMEMHPLEFMQTPWSAGTLETPADMERLFTLLERFRGGDDLPALFQPMYIVGSPDYEAIAANSFAAYVDVGLDEGVSPGWERGDIVGKAREGMERGVWHPGYHGRAHHFSPDAWLARLRQGNAWARFAFRRRTYVCENVAERLPEFAGMSEEQQYAWVTEGLNRFERCFGFRARSTRNHDYCGVGRRGALRALTAGGIRDITYEGPMLGLDQSMVVTPQPIAFEPFLTADREDVVGRVLGAIEEQWQAGQPAVISTHRRNYKAFEPQDNDAAASLGSGRGRKTAAPPTSVDSNFACLRRLLRAIARRHPDAVYLCGDEVAQLERHGYSIVERGRSIVCRNYSDRPLPVSVDVAGEVLSMTLPRGELVIRPEGNNPQITQIFTD